MKRTLITIIIILTSWLSAGCELYFDEADYYKSIEVGSIEDYEFENDIEELETLYDALKWRSRNIEYNNDIDIWGIEEYWQLPETTYELKSGDCEDKAMLILYLLSEFLCEDENDLYVDILVHSTTYHAVAYNDRTKQYYWGTNIKNKILWGWELHRHIPYKKALWMAKYYHRTVGEYYF